MFHKRGRADAKVKPKKRFRICSREAHVSHRKVKRKLMRKMEIKWWIHHTKGFFLRWIYQFQKANEQEIKINHPQKCEKSNRAEEMDLPPRTFLLLLQKLISLIMTFGVLWLFYALSWAATSTSNRTKFFMLTLPKK